MSNIVIRLHFLCIAYMIFCTHVSAQDNAIIAPLVIKDAESLAAVVRSDSNHRMVSLNGTVPNIIFDLRYAGKNNFTGKRLYPRYVSNSYLRLPAARALQQVATELQHNGIALKIFDAYRPYSTTVYMWNLVKDERYAANPAKGSGHNRGIAVDLTLVDIRTGKELPMGTGFDHFSDSAHHSFTALDSTVLNNRQLLRTVMERHGFRALETEWWHYSWPNDRAYGILDLGFRKLASVGDPL